MVSSVTDVRPGRSYLSLTGVWRSRGYGWILEIDPDAWALFDVTGRACIEFERGDAADFAEAFDIVGRDDDKHLGLCVRNDITRYDFDRVAKRPDEVLQLDQDRDHSPLHNLDFFCDVFAQDYAFFDLRGVDWDAACAAARSRIDDKSNPAALFAELHTLISPLRDNHVVLSNGKRTVRSERMARLKALIRDQLGLGDSSIGHLADIEKIRAFINREFLGSSVSTAGNGIVNWGMMTPSVAYLNVLKLFGLAATGEAKSASDLPPRRADHARFLRNDLNAIERIMDQVMSDLGHADALILDLRLNGGGFDNLGMAIAGRFTDRRRLTFTKHARDGSGVTPKQAFYVEPAGGEPFTKPVYVLTSPRTASAGDVFALCLRSLPNVTLIGQPSTGILSDNLKKHLPNGWVTSLSNEFYCSPDDQLFEGSGVPVDVETPVFVERDFRAGYHIAVDKALELAAGGMVKKR